MSTKPADATFYIEDALGQKYCYTIADVDYEPAFRKHAAWWKRTGYKTIPTSSPRAPVKPFRVVVER